MEMSYAFPAANGMNHQTKQHLIILGLAALIILGGYIFMLQETLRHVGQVAEFAQSLREKRAQSETLVSVKHLIVDTAGARAELDHYFITTEGVVDFIERIEKIAKADGVTLVFTTVDAPKEEKVIASLDRLLLRFSATGSWEHVMRFFTLVESLPYAVFVTNTRIERQSPLLWQGAMTLTVYKHI